MRLLMIVNDDAGTSTEAAVEDVRQAFALEVEVSVVRTSTFEEVVEALGSRGDAEIVVCGGDGSLHVVVTALCRLGELGDGGSEGPVVGLVPLGTGNDLARAISLPTDPVEATKVVLHGPVRPIDVIRDDEGRVVVNAVHVGTGEEAGRLAKPWKERLGTVGYVVGAVGAGVRKAGWMLKVTVDGEVVADGRTRLLQVGMANGTSIGGGTVLAPDAAPGDGLADIMITDSLSRPQRLRYALHLRRGDRSAFAGVRRMRGREVRVETMTDHLFGVNADGELIAPVRAVTWRVQPAAYRLHVPAGVEPTVAGQDPVA